MLIADVMTQIEAVAPVDTAQEWDNVGLQVGAPDWPLMGVLVCLEITPAVVDEADRHGANMIVAHHPLIFRPLTAIRTDRPLGALIERLLADQVGVYVAHTNLDAAPGVGTAAALAELLGVEKSSPLVEAGEVGLGLVGNLQSAATVAELEARVREVLSPARVTIVGDTSRTVGRLALMPGSGGDAVEAAVRSGADALICGDLKHHDALDALALGLTVIDATHYATERPVVARLVSHLVEKLGADVPVLASRVITDPFAADQDSANRSDGQ